MAHKQIYYSDKYFDEQYEYRHVMLPRELSKQVPKSHLMSEEEWRRLGVQQSLGWVHYMIHEPVNRCPVLILWKFWRIVSTRAVEPPKKSVFQLMWCKALKLLLTSMVGIVGAAIPEPHILLFRRPLPKDEQK